MVVGATGGGEAAGACRHAQAAVDTNASATAKTPPAIRQNTLSLMECVLLEPAAKTSKMCLVDRQRRQQGGNIAPR
jgi:hypothetical protein